MRGTGGNYSILSYFEIETTSTLSRVDLKGMDSEVSVFPDTSNLVFRSVPTQAGTLAESNFHVTTLPSLYVPQKLNIEACTKAASPASSLTRSGGFARRVSAQQRLPGSWG